MKPLLKFNDITPKWINCKGIFGLYDAEKAKWTGMVGEVESNKADFAGGANFACTYGRSKVALCLPGIAYSARYWFTRYPQQVSPWLNLTKLMTPTSWAWTLASLVSVALCFNVASLVVRRWMGMRLKNIEIDLCPFR